MTRRRFRLAAIVLVVLLGCLGTAPPVFAAPALTLSTVALGNVFTDGQQVQVGLSTSAASVSWSVTDVNGATVTSGSQAAASTLQIPVTTRGWYQLSVQAADSGGTTTARTTFAIIGPLGATPQSGITTSELGDFQSSSEGWSFYPGSEYPGATGSFAQDTSDGHSGGKSGRLSGDFSGGGAYVSVKRAVPAVGATTLSFWARTTGNVSWINVRLTDSTGQVHQQRVNLSSATDWQSLAITRLNGGRQYVHFGGANDGVWHGPAKGVELVLDRNGITGGGTTATISIDDLTAGAPAAQPNTVLGDYESSAEGWSFYPGSEFPGATGSYTLDPSTGHTGVQSAKLSANFSGGGNYVALQRDLTSQNLSSLTLWVRTTQVSSIGLRLTDATGQVHQQRLPLSGSSNWQSLAVSRFDAGTSYLHFGGADDGIWHGPAKAISLTLDKPQIIGGGTAATVSIDSVTALYSGPLLGAGTHFGAKWSPDPLPLVALSGARTVRDEAYWGDAETTRGTFAFPAKVTNYLTTLQNNSIDPLLIADYGNCLYDCPDQAFNAPSTDPGRAAFANYADALLTKYPQVKNLAVWNEWDNNAAGPANKSPDSYLALLKATYARVKAGHPAVTVVGGGDTDVNQVAWFQSFAALGGLRYLDAVSIHPYNYLHAPESLGTYIAQLRAIIRQYNGGVDKPIWITEAGWRTATSSDSVDEGTQAMYVARAELVTLGLGIQRHYLYDFMNDGSDPAGLEDNFGLIHHSTDPLGPYTPKPSYVAYATAARQLAGATFLGKENPGNGLIDQVFSAADGSPLRAVWAATGANTTVTVNAGGPIQVTSLYGLSTTFTPDAAGNITVPVGVRPVYVKGSTINYLSTP
ncbi:glycosyl hydrolase [Kribbella sp. NPDC006257]|uniref:glycosyl hydrolase n=1 Tax=Kribbella sp. NPDC006257 TaxID=3156738 RepID=UPI0033A3E3DE